MTVNADTRCDLTDLLTTDCAHCKQAAKPTEGAVWEALYPGRCPTCTLTFDAGVKVKWSSGGEPEHAYHG